ncbi:hypothetical protein [Effusibacillus lacus]|nr:hypothetical protein [Effusibacillus lacus]
MLKPFGYEEVMISIEGKPAGESFFSHMGSSGPFKAKDPAQYEFVKD